MNKRNIVIAVCALVILALSWVVWYGKISKEKQKTNNNPVSNQQNQHQTAPEEEKFVTDIDPDVNHWQTKETEFFTIKFPKEWYWLEPDPKKTEYHSQVITNNPNFEIDKYPDIGIATGGAFRFSSRERNDQSLQLSPAEVVITTNNLGWATSNSGTPREFMEGEIARLKKDLYPEMKCHYTSNINSISLTAFCSFPDNNGQVVATYYDSRPKRTFAYTARFVQGNPIEKDIEHILENIAKSMMQKSDF